MPFGFTLPAPLLAASALPFPADLAFPTNPPIPDANLVPNPCPVVIGLTLPAPLLAASALAFPADAESLVLDDTPIPKYDITLFPRFSNCFPTSPDVNTFRNADTNSPALVNTFSFPASTPFAAPSIASVKISSVFLDGECSSRADLKDSRNSSTPSFAGSFSSSKPSNPSSAPYTALANFFFVFSSNPSN